MTVSIPKGGGLGPTPSSPKSTGDVLPSGGSSAPSAVMPPTLAVHPLSRGPSLGEATAALAQDQIRSEFPLNDLGAITTQGRWPTGFRLDSGSLRLMWVGVRRFKDKKDQQGYEIFLYTQGKSVERLEQRMKEKGAVSGSLEFAKAELDDSQTGRSRLVHAGESWSPSGSGLRLQAEGKYQVDYCPSTPEALKGALRVRVFGGDKEATDALKEVVNRLGLQSLLAPPTPDSLERFKLSRFLWSVAPEKLANLRFRSPLGISAELVEGALDQLGQSKGTAGRDQIENAATQHEPILSRLKLMTLLADRDPSAFLSWASSENPLPPSYPVEPNKQLKDALSGIGLGPDHPDLGQALAAPLEPGQARHLLRTAFLARRSRAEAEKVLSASAESMPLSQLRQAIASSGIDLGGERLANLRFEEVYPGYFTVVDPSLPARLADVGARYLYSTVEDPARVYELLSQGQKSSLTRFSEGRLVQGKSSSADFGTGGAFSVFTRLVTASAIQKAKASKGSSYGDSFSNWGGSRPYKLILNRRLLARLDWYGYNGDHYGRTTGLGAANHGEKLIKTINDQYSTNNELMFPVGNDPSYVDFVVCETPQQRDKLIAHLEEQGLSAFNGRPLESFVRVEKKFFEHPDDCTLELAIKDALGAVQLRELEGKLAELAVSQASPVVLSVAQKAAESCASVEASEAALEVARRAAEGSGKNAAAKAAKALFGGLDLGPLKTSILGAARTAAREAAEAAAVPAALGTSTKSVEQSLRTLGKGPARNAAKAAAEPLVAQAKAEALDGPAKGLPRSEKITLLKKLMRAAALDAAEAAARAAIEEPLHAAALEKAEAVIEANVKKSAQSAAKSAFQETALERLHQAQASGTLKGLRVELEAEIREKVEQAATAAVQKSVLPPLKRRIRAQVDDAIRKAARAASEEKVRTQAKESTSEILREAAKAAAASFLEARGETPGPETEALIADFTGKAAEQRVETLVEQAMSAALGKLPKAGVQEAVEAAATAATKDAASGIAPAAASAVVSESADDAIERQLRSLSEEMAKSEVDPLAQEIAKATAADHAPALAEKVAGPTVEAVAKQWASTALTELTRPVEHEP